MASVTTKEVFISLFRLSKSSMESIIKASCNSDRIVFCFCFLDYETDTDIDISGPDYKTTYLSFRASGCQSNWNSSPTKLKRIIKAISLSSFKNSLKTLDILGWGLGVTEVEWVLDEFKMKHVKIVKEDGLSIDE